MQHNLSSDIFFKVWSTLAQRINDFIVEQILTRHHFAVGGAFQFKHDMQALFLLFSPYTPHPENYFKEYVNTKMILIDVV